MKKIISVLLLLSVLISPCLAIQITLLTPNSTQTLNKNPTFNFTATSTVNTTFSCELFINGTGYGINTSVQNNTATIIQANQSLDFGNYEWHINCTDSNSTMQSENRTIGIGANFSRCVVLVDSGEYHLNGNITDTSFSHCINITANNVVLDCEGHLIDGNSSADYGIYMSRPTAQTTNITIKNCVLKDWKKGVYLENASSNTLINITIFNNTHGIFFLYSNNNTLKNSKIENNTYGVYLNSTKTNLFYNNLFNNTNNIYINGTNLWNTTKQNGNRIYSPGTQIGGNYWTNPNGTGYSDICNDTNHDGFCDKPYNLTTNNTDYLPLSGKFAVLKLSPIWNLSVYYFKNQTLSADEEESINTSRRLFVNLNQTKTLNFIITNTENLNLTINQQNSTNLTNGNLTLNFTEIHLTQSISPKGFGYLNITIEPPKNSSYIGEYYGWVYLNSTCNLPFNNFNLTLKINVTNKTLPRLERPIYYFDPNNQTKINFSIYFFDNNTKDRFWNSSYNYNLTLVNSLNNSQVLQNISFSFSNGLFSGTINTTKLTEGNYTILGNLTDLVNNIAEINLTFELLHNLDLNVSENPDNIVGGYNFTLNITVSKLGSVEAKNVTVCISLPEGIYLGSNNSIRKICKNLSKNISNSTSEVINWTLKPEAKYVPNPYKINITAFSADGRFNQTRQENIPVNYGNLVSSLYYAPSSKKINKTFDVSVYVNNTGSWSATNVTVKIEVCGTSKNTNCSGENISAGGHLLCEAEDFSCSSSDTKNIYVILQGVKNATYASSTKVGEITIEEPSSSDNNNNNNQDQQLIYYISLYPGITTFEVPQGGKKDFEVRVKNSGNTVLNDVYLTLTGLNSNYFSISPSSKEDLGSGSTRTFTIHFHLPENLEPKNYSLTLKAISNEKTTTKTITLKVLKVALEFINLSDINLTQGTQIIKKFKIKNTGETTIHNLYPIVSNFNLTISPVGKINLSKNTQKEYSLNFSISPDHELEIVEITLQMISDEKNFTKTFNLTILPSEEEKSKMRQEYERLLIEFANLTHIYGKTKDKIENLSAVQAKIDLINETLKQIETALNEGKYFEAKNKIESLKSEILELSTYFETEVKDSSIPIYLVLLCVVVLSVAGFVLFYTFLPKQGYVPGKGYIMESKTHTFINRIKTIIKNLSKHKKTEDEILRQKKLTEWMKIYEEKKKRREYGY